MLRGRNAALALLATLALASSGKRAHAQTAAPAQVTAATSYTLEVESDAPDVVSFEALAARIAADLGGPVTRPGPTPPTGAAITIRYRDRELAVRAAHAGGRVLERSVRAEGDDAAVQREAILLASNLARDEARELLDALAARPPAPVPPPPPTPTAAAPVAKPPVKEEPVQRVTAAVFTPLATNYRYPDVTTDLNVSLFYGRVGRVNGAQLGTMVIAATRDVRGVQLAGMGSVVLGDLTGAQASGMFNVSRGRVTGFAVAGGANVGSAVEGMQLAPVNTAETVDGVQLGVVNVARKVRGAQLGVINIADEVEGTSLGLISISHGGVHPIAWASNLEYTNVGVKFSTKWVYTITALHYGTQETGFNTAVGTSAALGVHIPLPAHLDLEVQGLLTNITPEPKSRPDDTNLWLASQAIAGFSFANHLRVFAGGGARFPAQVEVSRAVTRPEVLGGVQF